MINIRSDDDASPKDVLDAMTPEEAAQVRAHATVMLALLAKHIDVQSLTSQMCFIDCFTMDIPDTSLSVACTALKHVLILPTLHNVLHSAHRLPW